MPETFNLIAAAPEVGYPTVFGIADYQWVSIAMVVLLAIFVWAKVPGTVTRGLDSKIAEIKEQLDEAKSLRTEAEKLRDEYAAKIAAAQNDAEAMMDNARTEADAIVAKAEADSDKMVARRQRMAEEKIAAAEREAIQDVRNAAARAATAASRKLIAERHDGESDRALADEVIAFL
jgi:F-type H+-transporting ATPase subunit b